MKLNQILGEAQLGDPSDFRQGDQHDPRSPHYDGDDEDGDHEVHLTMPWFLYDQAGEETQCQIEVLAKMEVSTGAGQGNASMYRRAAAQDIDLDGPEQSVQLASVQLVSVRMQDGKVIPAAVAMQQFSADNFDPEAMKENARDELNKTRHKSQYVK